jgi:thiamine biosynthesis lipoprotein
VPASPLLRDAVRAALWAARRSGGLVDPTLLGALERAGYGASRADAAPAPLPLDPPPPQPARADPASPWRRIGVDDRRGVIRRPCGVRLDLGGSGKGHVADLVARLLDGAVRWAIDAGGDLRVGGTAGPQPVEVAHPFPGRPPAARLGLVAGAVATSAIHVRAWRRADGRPAHHLLDPMTGEPAWTGVISATALAPTVLEAETLSKTALLSGPERGARVLARHGGLLVAADGTVTPVPAPGGPPRPPRRWRASDPPQDPDATPGGSRRGLRRLGAAVRSRRAA